jgi:hypothetical protein
MDAAICESLSERFNLPPGFNEIGISFAQTGLHTDGGLVCGLPACREEHKRQR